MIIGIKYKIIINIDAYLVSSCLLSCNDRYFSLCLCHWLTATRESDTVSSLQDVYVLHNALTSTPKTCRPRRWATRVPSQRHVGFPIWPKCPFEEDVMWCQCRINADLDTMPTDCVNCQHVWQLYLVFEGLLTSSRSMFINDSSSSSDSTADDQCDLLSSFDLMPCHTWVLKIGILIQPLQVLQAWDCCHYVVVCR